MKGANGNFKDKRWLKESGEITKESLFKEN